MWRDGSSCINTNTHLVIWAILSERRVYEVIDYKYSSVSTAVKAQYPGNLRSFQRLPADLVRVFLDVFRLMAVTKTIGYSQTKIIIPVTCECSCIWRTTCLVQWGVCVLRTGAPTRISSAWWWSFLGSWWRCWPWPSPGPAPPPSAPWSAASGRGWRSRYWFAVRDGRREECEEWCAGNHLALCLVYLYLSTHNLFTVNHFHFSSQCIH